MTARARRGIAADQRVIGGTDVGEHIPGQRLELLGNGHAVGLLRQLARSPGNPRRQVGDPLPVAVDLQNGRHAPQVGGDRLEQGEDPQALLLDPDLGAIGCSLEALDLVHHVETALANHRDALR